MEASFHIFQGSILINNQDVESIRKALHHFREANLKTESGDIAKPIVLYNLAYGNLIIGHIDRAYIIANKALRELENSRNSSIFVMEKFPGEDNINGLLSFLNDKYPELKDLLESDYKDFDENFLELSNMPESSGRDNRFKYENQVDLESINDEVLMLIFSAMLRNDNDLIYFDKRKLEPVIYVEGYLVSTSGDSVLNNRMLANKIMNNAAMDLVDEERHILIPKLLISDFLIELQKFTDDTIGFESVIEIFSSEILKEFEDMGIKSLSTIYLTNYTIDLMFKVLQKKIEYNSDSMKLEFNNMFEKAACIISKALVNGIFNKS